MWNFSVVSIRCQWILSIFVILFAFAYLVDGFKACRGTLMDVMFSRLEFTMAHYFLDNRNVVFKVG